MLLSFILAELPSAWYLLPLAAAVSLVYSTSRFELTERIVRRSVRLFSTIVGFMLVVFVILWGFG